MASIDALPVPILAKIFAFLREYELFAVERVCRLWRSVAEYMWNRLECIDEQTIGYPNDDYLKNFFLIVHRMKKCRKFINPFSLIDDDDDVIPVAESVQDRWKGAVLELVSKRTPNATFPMDFLRDVLHLTLNQMRREKSEKNSSLRVNEAYYVVSQTMREYQVTEFSSIRIPNIYLQHKVVAGNSLTVMCDGNEIAFPLDDHKITHVTIGRLVIRLKSIIADYKESLEQVRFWRNRFSAFLFLKQVEIESIELVLPSAFSDVTKVGESSTPGEEPILSITINFIQNGFLLSVEEFYSFFDLLARNDIETRNRKLARMIRTWRNRNVLKGGTFQVHSYEFEMIDYVMSLTQDCKRKKRNEINGKNDDDEEEDSENDGEEDVDGLRTSADLRDDPERMMVALVLPAVTDCLHVTISMSYEENKDFLDMFTTNGVFTGLKELSFSYAEPVSYRHQSVKPDADSFLMRTHRLQYIICDHLSTVERLRFNFLAGGSRWSLPKLEPPSMVTRPLPLLHTVEVKGFPSFQFLTSIVENCVNLRRLIIESQPCKDDSVGLKRLLKLLECVQFCRNLRYFCFNTCNEGAMILACSGFRRKRPISVKAESMLKPLLLELESQLACVVASLPRLLCLSVKVPSWNFSYEVDKRSWMKSRAPGAD